MATIILCLCAVAILMRLDDLLEKYSGYSVVRWWKRKVNDFESGNRFQAHHRKNWY